MQVEIKIDPSYTEPQITILTASMTDDIKDLVQKISADLSPIISGYKNDKVEILDENDLIHMYASAGKVFAVTHQGHYLLRLRLYELEERLAAHHFVRISNSEIINLKKVHNFDLSITGTIRVKLSNGTSTYVSRRYVSKLKKILGI